jgi:hypothetical protein
LGVLVLLDNVKTYETPSTVPPSCNLTNWNEVLLGSLVVASVKIGATPAVCTYHTVARLLYWSKSPRLLSSADSNYEPLRFMHLYFIAPCLALSG